MRDPDLWHRLKAYPLERPGDDQGFTAKLRTQNKWDHAFADAVTDDYRRFVYLSQVSETPVTPSQAIDKAWHLHLTHTRAYWDGLCKDVLARPLHHDPSAGAGDDAKHAAQYARTLALYEAEFGMAPSEALWPRMPAKPAQAGGRTRRTAIKLGALACVGVVSGVMFFTGNEDISGAGLAVLVVLVFFFLAARDKAPGSGGAYSGHTACSSSSDGGADCGGD
ncbi:hypothetical protein [Aliiroseovarius subalbicans]|uniref:glycine-rich domain-containing protein n=1 Tax=Aliiroseovarius subalbicans TaxID=2925840 RepID=UPI001F5A898B|nr:hypothetical protein [Aliiroseovarius subalbicans]MCI2400492.1 hypothetical protein [Aliiroseovarius subalbicans]